MGLPRPDWEKPGARARVLFVDLRGENQHSVVIGFGPSLARSRTTMARRAACHVQEISLISDLFQ